jgi:hypothetical protein
MKLLILIFPFLFSAVDESYVQCGKNIRLTSSKTIYMDGNGNITQTEIEKSVVEINQLLITINVRDESKTVCNIKSIECNWDIPFKNGKTLIEATLNTKDGELKNVVLTIQGIDGQLILLFEMEDRPDKLIKVIIDMFEEGLE